MGHMHSILHLLGVTVQRTVPVKEPCVLSPLPVLRNNEEQKCHHGIVGVTSKTCELSPLPVSRNNEEQECHRGIVGVASKTCELSPLPVSRNNEEQ